MANFLPCSGALRGVILVSVMTVKLLRRILAMSPPAWEITLRSLQLSCVMLFCSWMLLAGAGTYSIETNYVYQLAYELARLPQAVLLAAVIAGAVIEEGQAL